MRAVLFNSYGGPENVEVGEVPEPHAGAGQVRVAVRAASVNPLDWKILSGAMSGGQPLERAGVLGFDAAGVVDEVGADVSGVQVGDAVFGTGQGTAADFAVLTAWAAKPESVDWPAAAGAAVAGETSERVFRLLEVPSGGTVFIDGGAGGVGSVAVQYAIAHGLRVVASAGPDNQDYLRWLGASPVLYGEGVATRVRQAAGGGNVDGVFDVAGKTAVQELVGLVPEPGKVVSIANFDAAQAGARVTGGSQDAQPQKALAEIAGLLAAGKITLPVRQFAITDAAQALAVSHGGHVRGKLILVL